MQKIVARNKHHLLELVEEAVKKYGNNADLNFIDVSNIDDMSNLFSFSFFNGDISKWNVSNVKNMENMFEYSWFNGDISKWNVSSVENMKCMFGNSKFNRDISEWNVSNVEDMSWMFFKSSFNMDIGKWNVSNTINMQGMFEQSLFNSDISGWNVSNVKDTSWMFYKSKFDKDLSKWKLCARKTTGMFDGTPLEKRILEQTYSMINGKMEIKDKVVLKIHKSKNYCEEIPIHSLPGYPVAVFTYQELGVNSRSYFINFVTGKTKRIKEKDISLYLSPNHRRNAMLDAWKPRRRGHKLSF